MKIVSRRALPVAMLFAGAAILLLALLASLNSASASSHREAPAISKDPNADNTDTYAWIPLNKPNKIVVAATFLPFEAPEGGPNYFEFDDNVLYDIYVDIDGDARAEVTYTLQSQTHVRNPNTFLYNTGPITSLDDEDWNRYQTYTITEYFEPGLQPGAGSRVPQAHIQTVVGDVYAPPSNIGSKSTPDWHGLMMDAIYTWDDPRNGDVLTVYAGQADDPFWVDLQIFDLLTLRGQAEPIGYADSQPGSEPIDSLAGFNVHAMVLEIPATHLTRNGETVLGVWSATRRIDTIATRGGEIGAPTQVSRLGMPLVNEVVIPMGLKDVFNAIPPSVDLAVYSLLQESVEDPEVGNLLCALYGVPLPEDDGSDCDTDYDSVDDVGGLANAGSGRGDIFQIYLTGIKLESTMMMMTADGPEAFAPGFNINQPSGVVPAEMIRINTKIKAKFCNPTPNYQLGLAGGDACGFPNGRRLQDDVVDISLLAVAGALYQPLDGEDGSFEFSAGLIDVLEDGLSANDVPFQTDFPYLAPAHSGQEHLHTNPSDLIALILAPTSIAMSALAAAGVPNGALLEVFLGGLALVLWLTVVAVRRVRREES